MSLIPEVERLASLHQQVGYMEVGDVVLMRSCVSCKWRKVTPADVAKQTTAKARKQAETPAIQLTFRAPKGYRYVFLLIGASQIGTPIDAEAMLGALGWTFTGTDDTDAPVAVVDAPAQQQDAAPSDATKKLVDFIESVYGPDFEGRREFKRLFDAVHREVYPFND